MSILKYLVKQSNPTQDSSTAISLPVNARVSQSSIEEAECEDAHDMEFVHSSSARMYVIKPPQISKVVSGHAQTLALRMYYLELSTGVSASTAQERVSKMCFCICPRTVKRWAESW